PAGLPARGAGTAGPEISQTNRKPPALRRSEGASPGVGGRLLSAVIGGVGAFCRQRLGGRRGRFGGGLCLRAAVGLLPSAVRGRRAAGFSTISRRGVEKKGRFGKRGQIRGQPSHRTERRVRVSPSTRKRTAQPAK